MSGHVGDVPISKFFTEVEIAEIDATQPTERKMTEMPTHNRTPLSANATREEKLAALPPLAGAGGSPAFEDRLQRLSDDAMGKLGELDTALTDLAEEFADRFAEDDARAATRSRISATATANRAATRRR